MSKSIYIFIAGLTTCLWINFINIDRPPFDFHHYRQCQTLSTIQMFSKEGIDLLKPKTNYMGEPGILVLELPLYQAIASLIYSRSGGESLVALRWLNIFISMLCIGTLYLTAKRFMSTSGSLIACGFYMASPLFINFMGSIMLDPFGVWLGLLAFLCVHRILYQDPIIRVSILPDCLAILFSGILLSVIKPLYLFPCVSLMGIFAICGFKKWKSQSVKLILVGLLFLPALVAMILWQVEATAINKSYDISLNPAVHLGMSALLNLRWYRDIGLRILWQSAGGAGIFALTTWAICLFNLWKRKRITGLFLPLVTMITVLGYLIVFANINFPHDYYFLLPLPFLCLAAAYGLEICIPDILHCFVKSKAKCNAIGGMLAICACIFSLVQVWSHPTFPQVESMVKLEALGKAKFDYQSFGVVFVDNAIGTGRAPWPSPAAMTALGLRGFGLVTNNREETIKLWKEYSPKVKNLEYVVFYGMNPLNDIVPVGFKLAIEDEQNKLFCYKKD